MTFDKTHDIQAIYRKVLDAMSRPGKVNVLAPEVEKLTLKVDVLPATLGLILMLLDSEVSFHVVSVRSDVISQLISQLTYAKEENIEQADYVFVLKDAPDHTLAETFRNVKIGNLIDPQKSATLIIEVKAVAHESSKTFTMQGPGIKDVSALTIAVDDAWVEARKEVNGEFPFGVDAMFVDEQARIVCLPRTTQIVEDEVK